MQLQEYTLLAGLSILIIFTKLLTIQSQGEQRKKELLQLSIQQTKALHYLNQVAITSKLLTDTQALVNLIFLMKVKIFLFSLKMGLILNIMFVGLFYTRMLQLLILLLMMLLTKTICIAILGIVPQIQYSVIMVIQIHQEQRGLDFLLLLTLQVQAIMHSTYATLFPL